MRKTSRNTLLSHSYKRIEYKCQECDFYGTDDLAMVIHIKKVHSEMIECGICDSVFEDPENFDLHLFTCEAYQSVTNVKYILKR